MPTNIRKAFENITSRPPTQAYSNSDYCNVDLVVATLYLAFISRWHLCAVYNVRRYSICEFTSFCDAVPNAAYHVEVGALGEKTHGWPEYATHNNGNKKWRHRRECETVPEHTVRDTHTEEQTHHHSLRAHRQTARYRFSTTASHSPHTTDGFSQSDLMIACWSLGQI